LTAIRILDGLALSGAVVHLSFNAGPENRVGRVAPELPIAGAAHRLAYADRAGA